MIRPRKPKSRMARHLKLDVDAFELLLRMFADDRSAAETSRETGVNQRSVNERFHQLRERINDFALNVDLDSFNSAGYILRKAMGDLRNERWDGFSRSHKAKETYNKWDAFAGTPREGNGMFAKLRRRMKLFESAQERAEASGSFRLGFVGELFQERCLARKLPTKHEGLHLSEIYLREICRFRWLGEVDEDLFRAYIDDVIGTRKIRDVTRSSLMDDEVPQQPHNQFFLEEIHRMLRVKSL